MHFRDLRLCRWDGAAHLWVAEAADTSTVSVSTVSSVSVRLPPGRAAKRAAKSYEDSDLLEWVDASGPFIELCRQRIGALVGPEGR